MNAEISDLCIMAATEGMPYQDLITEILYLGAERFGLPYDPLIPTPAAAKRSVQTLLQRAPSVKVAGSPG
jgi:hypothetical protein